MRICAQQVLAAVVAGLTAMSLAGCGSGGGGGRDGFTVGLLLPSRGLPRWEQYDKPLVEKKLKELCARCTVAYRNAENDATRQRLQMNSMIANGVRVVILDAVAPEALRSSVRTAHRANVPVVAYDRLAEGPISGFVTYDGARIGRLQGEALLKAMGEKAHGGQVVMMNGDPTSPNAAWYAQGALSVIKGKVKIGKTYDTLAWTTESARDRMTAAITALGPERIGGVLAANDAIAAGVVTALKNAHVEPLPPVTGQDAELEAVRRIVRGEQYMTVYKPFGAEAAAAAAMAVALERGERIGGNTTVKGVPAVLLAPIAVTLGNIRQTLVEKGVYTTDQICTPELRHACDTAGLLRETHSPGKGR
ncbi:substrate-binding domain-containing protein [Streptomyces sp. NPDC047000]|uniref:sugar ABC transporter substrate-binding protein n=1 Tax=Streptomyces sp. NPDC047000 TaxID=3155474 RepID=UPI0033E16279